MSLRIIILFSLFIININYIFPQGTWISLEKPTTQNLRRISFIDTAVGWIAGDSGTVMKTNNGGLNWIDQNTNISNDILDMSVSGPNHVWALARQYDEKFKLDFGTIFLYTTNGGDDWNTQFFPDAIFDAVEFLDSLTGFIGGAGGKIYKTTNGGGNWHGTNVDSSLFSAFPIQNFKFMSPQVGFAMGGFIDIIGVVWRTSDGGESWTVTSDLTFTEPVRDMYFKDSLNIFAVSGDADWGTSKVTSTDAGLTWAYTYLGIWGEGASIDFRNSLEGWVALGFSGTYMYTLDGGENWTDLYAPDSAALYDVLFIDENHGFMVGKYGNIIKYVPTTTNVEDHTSLLSKVYSLNQNYPNPFNPSTKITYRLSDKSYISLEVFNLLGKKIITLFEGIQAVGSYRQSFDGTNLSSGVYLYKLTVQSTSKNKNKYTTVKKMLLLK